MFETAQPQAEEAANQPEIMPESGEERDMPDDAFLTVRYNKEERPLSRDAAVEYAQKGMNYDKISERLKQATERLAAYEQGATNETARGGDMGAADERQAEVDGQLDAFMRDNPGVDPRRLPAGVLNDWKSGVPLSKAYLAHQARDYQRRLEAMEKAAETNRRNAAASMGRATGGRGFEQAAFGRVDPQHDQRRA